MLPLTFLEEPPSEYEKDSGSSQVSEGAYRFAKARNWNGIWLIVYHVRKPTSGRLVELGILVAHHTPLFRIPKVRSKAVENIPQP